MNAGRPQPDLRTRRLRVRFPHENDAGAIARYYVENRSHLERFGPSRPDSFYTEAFWRTRIAEMQDEFRADVAIAFLVFLPEAEAEVVGQVNLFNIARKVFQCATMGYSVAQAYQGRGYTTEACQAVVEYAFGDLNLHRVQAGHLPENLASAAVLRKLGFAAEGYARDFLYFHGKWRDHVLLAKTNPEWEDRGR